MYLLGVLLLLLCSCSSADKVLSEKAEKTISMLENLQKENRMMLLFRKHEKTLYSMIIKASLGNIGLERYS